MSTVLAYLWRLVVAAAGHGGSRRLDADHSVAGLFGFLDDGRWLAVRVPECGPGELWGEQPAGYFGFPGIFFFLVTVCSFCCAQRL